MATHHFDPHALLLKLRNPQGTVKEAISYDRRLPPPFPDQIPRPNPEERPDVIQEMQKEIQELSAEVSRLRSSNKQLNHDKKALEIQLAEYKEKSDDTIAKLRNHIVSLNKKLNSVKSSPPKSQTDRYSSRKTTGRASTQSRTKPAEYENSIHKSFSGPTFSEIMRRNTPESHGFKDSLRKDRVPGGSTQHRTTSYVPHDEFPPLPPPSPEDDRHANTMHASPERGVLNRTHSLTSQGGDRKGTHSSLQRAFSFEPDGLSQDEAEDDDDDLPVVDIDLRY